MLNRTERNNYILDFILDFLKSTSAEFITIIISLSSILLSTTLTLKKIRLDLLNEKNNKEIKEKFKKLSNDSIESINISLNNNDNKNDESLNNLYSSIIEKNVINMNTNLRELYEKRNFDKNLKKISFILAVVMSIVGTAILFIGLIICLFTTEKIGWITTASGAIVELVASIYFWLVNRTMKEVKENSKQLEKNEDLLTAIELVEKIDDTKIKNETYKIVVEKLISKN